MSYNVELLDPETNEVIEFDKKHNIKGETYELNGSNRAWLNITYNYSKHFYRVLGEKGIGTIYGLTGEQSRPLLEDAISKLKNDIDYNDYWNPTEGNAREALLNLCRLAKLAPYGIWGGD